MLLYIAVKPY